MKNVFWYCICAFIILFFPIIILYYYNSDMPHENNTYIDKKDDRLNIILDTDTYNECDDQFALAYLLSNQDIFNIKLITVAPYSHPQKNVGVTDGLPLSYNEIIKISKLADFDYLNKVFIGSSDYLSNGYNETNPAVENIIDTVMKNEKTYILATGAITNIALSIMKEPSIIDKMEVIWLGGNSLTSINNDEYNFRQDVEAVRYVIKSGVKLTILPCQGVVSNLEMNINDLRSTIYNKGKLSNYLIDLFSNGDYFGNPESRVIWDISVVAYMINSSWFDMQGVNISGVNDDLSYEYDENGNNIQMAVNLNKNEIFNDLYFKLINFR